MLSYEPPMKRNPSIERLFRWRFFSHEKSPRSVIRLVARDPDWDTDLQVGDEFRIGYYSRQNSPNCVWLVDAAENYFQTWEQISLLDTFEIVFLSEEADIYGLHRPVLEPL
jgi:hypothetical protein